jgi:hypothetical protein
MAHFITDLDARKHTRDASADRRGTWALLSQLVFSSDVLQRKVIVPMGFVTDFASVPRIPVAYLLTGDCGHAAAVLHDWAYTSHLCTRSEADALFHEALLAGGEPRWRAWLMWLGVRIGGAGPYRAAGQKQPWHVEYLVNALHPDGP